MQHLSAPPLRPAGPPQRAQAGPPAPQQPGTPPPPWPAAQIAASQGVLSAAPAPHAGGGQCMLLWWWACAPPSSLCWKGCQGCSWQDRVHAHLGTHGCQALLTGQQAGLGSGAGGGPALPGRRSCQSGPRLPQPGHAPLAMLPVRCSTLLRSPRNGLHHTPPLPEPCWGTKSVRPAAGRRDGKRHAGLPCIPLGCWMAAHLAGRPPGSQQQCTLTPLVLPPQRACTVDRLRFGLPEPNVGKQPARPTGVWGGGRGVPRHCPAAAASAPGAPGAGCSAHRWKAWRARQRPRWAAAACQASILPRLAWRQAAQARQARAVAACPACCRAPAARRRASALRAAQPAQAVSTRARQAARARACAAPRCLRPCPSCLCLCGQAGTGALVQRAARTGRPEAATAGQRWAGGHSCGDGSSRSSSSRRRSRQHRPSPAAGAGLAGAGCGRARPASRRCTGGAWRRPQPRSAWPASPGAPQRPGTSPAALCSPAGGAAAAGLHSHEPKLPRPPGCCGLRAAARPARPCRSAVSTLARLQVPGGRGAERAGGLWSMLRMAAWQHGRYARLQSRQALARTGSGACGRRQPTWRASLAWCARCRCTRTRAPCATWVRWCQRLSSRLCACRASSSSAALHDGHQVGTDCRLHVRQRAAGFTSGRGHARPSMAMQAAQLHAPAPLLVAQVRLDGCHEVPQGPALEGLAGQLLHPLLPTQTPAIGTGQVTAGGAGRKCPAGHSPCSHPKEATTHAGMQGMRAGGWPVRVPT